MKIIISTTFYTADDLLNEKPRSCLSRIPKLTSSPKHHAYGRQLMLGLGAQTSSRDSSDYSGGSCYSDCDFTGSTDSGVDVRETSSLRAMARFGRHPSLGKYSYPVAALIILL